VRDILHHASGRAGSAPKVQESLIRWTLVVQEIGYALIGLRTIRGRNVDDVALAVAHLFDQPTTTRRLKTLTCVEKCIAATSNEVERAYLLVIRGVLLDRQTPLVSE
jgi:hypothetical protein